MIHTAGFTSKELHNEMRRIGLEFLKSIKHLMGSIDCYLFSMRQRLPAANHFFLAHSVLWVWRYKIFFLSLKLFL